MCLTHEHPKHIIKKFISVVSSFRDYASINELICLSNMENLNAVFINQSIPQGERLIKLNQIAIQQMKILERQMSSLIEA